MSESTESGVAETASEPAGDGTPAVSKSVKSYPKKFRSNGEEVIMSRNQKDRMELLQMKKQTENFDKTEAVLKIVQTRRSEQNPNAEPKQKAAVQFSQMPWAPNPHFMLPRNSVSALGLEDHKRYVAIISNLIKFDKETRFVFNNVELQAMDDKLKEERRKYVTHVNEVFAKKRPYGGVFPGVFKFVTRRIKARSEMLSEKGYSTLVQTIDWKSDMTSTAMRSMYFKKFIMLETGRQPKLLLPDLTRICALNTDVKHLNERFGASKSILKDDATAMDLANQNDVDFVLSSCVLRHLLTAPYAIKSYRRGYPVTVKRQFVDGKPKRIVVVSNPVPISQLEKTELMKMYGKYMIRDFVEKVPVEHKISEVKMNTRVRPLKRKVTTDGKDVPDMNTASKKQKVDESKTEENEMASAPATSFSDLLQNMGSAPLLPVDESEDASDILKIDDDEEESVVEQEPAHASPSFINLLDAFTAPTAKPVNVAEIAKPKSPPVVVKPKASAAVGSSVDLLDSIMSNMEVPLPNQQAGSSSNSIYNYSLLDLEGLKVLLRSRCHGKDSIGGSSISFTSKIEYLPQCGAEVPFEEEKIWNALTAMVKGADIHVNMHVNLPDAHCLQYSTSKSEKLADNLKQESKELLAARWKRLETLLTSFEHLDDGEFFLVETDDAKLEIWSSEGGEEANVEWSRQKVEELSSVNKVETIASITPSFEAKFNGLDYHVPFQWHLVKSRIPISFLPVNPNKPMAQNRPDKDSGTNSRGRGNFQRGRGGRGGGRGFQKRGRGARGNNRGAQRGYIDFDANPGQDEATQWPVSSGASHQPSNKVKSLNEFSCGTDRIY